MTRRLAACAVLALTALAALARAGDAPTLPVASDGENIWVVVDRMATKGLERVLYHHGSGMGGAYMQEVLPFDALPAALAAARGHLWIVIPPQDALRTRSEVYTVATARHPLTGVYMYEPQGRLAILPSLADGGQFSGAAADGDTLLALRVPGTLERLAQAGWERVPGAPAGVQLIPWGPLAALVIRAQPLEAAVRTSADAWETFVPGVPAGATVAGVPGALRPAIVITQPDGSSTLAYARATAIVPLATLPRASGPWAVAGLGDAFVLLEATGDGSVAMRRIDGVDGRVSDAEVLAPPPPLAGEWIHIPLLGILLLAVVLGVVLLRNTATQARLPAPYGFTALPARRRLLALLVDIVPGIAVVLLLGYPPRSLLELPMLSPSTVQAVPGVILVLVTLGGCVLLELLTGASAGKWLVGGRVARMDPAGARPRIWQVLARNVFKAMFLLVPVTGFFTLTAPGGRGVGEVLSATAVIQRRTQETPLKPGSADGR